MLRGPARSIAAGDVGQIPDPDDPVRWLVEIAVRVGGVEGTRAECEINVVDVAVAVDVRIAGVADPIRVAARAHSSEKDSVV